MIERTASVRELDCRMSGGVEVALLWNSLDNSVVVSVTNTRGMRVQFGAESGTARDAFNHPYPYATAQGVRCEEIFLAA